MHILFRLYNPDQGNLPQAVALFRTCAGEEASNEGEDLKVQLFLQYLKAQEDEGYEGPFADWVGEELAEQLGLDDGEEEPELEEVCCPHPRGGRATGHVHSCPAHYYGCT